MGGWLASPRAGSLLSRPRLAGMAAVADWQGKHGDLGDRVGAALPGWHARPGAAALPGAHGYRLGLHVVDDQWLRIVQKVSTSHC